MISIAAICFSLPLTGFNPCRLVYEKLYTNWKHISSQQIDITVYTHNLYHIFTNKWMPINMFLKSRIRPLSTCIGVLFNSYQTALFNYFLFVCLFVCCCCCCFLWWHENHNLRERERGRERGGGRDVEYIVFTLCAISALLPPPLQSLVIS